jgi:hypothetical protein
MVLDGGLVEAVYPSPGIYHLFVHNKWLASWYIPIDIYFWMLSGGGAAPCIDFFI